MQLSPIIGRPELSNHDCSSPQCGKLYAKVVLSVSEEDRIIFLKERNGRKVFFDALSDKNYPSVREASNWLDLAYEKALERYIAPYNYGKALDAAHTVVTGASPGPYASAEYCMPVFYEWTLS